ncbi:MAG: hypothetical protein HBSAPP04_08910 [Ignavibacteriaceae bacterium]|nr:MAG: T9SS C-terminal target domain-containing protein [Chlorobiota bacterium]GJQ32052.1 MAG: hypothetical protein HBSAPP04_08910 [Ignavibacteriaceae bacterium]
MYSIFSRIIILFSALSCITVGQVQHVQNSHQLNGSRYGVIADPSGHLSFLKSSATMAGRYLPVDVTGDTTRYEFSYDGYYHLKDMVTKVKRNNIWSNFLKSTYSCDQNGNMVYILFQKWENSTWLITSRRICQYDSAGNLLSMEEDLWENNVFRPIGRYLYEYDPNGNLITEIRAFWFNNDWANSSRLSWTFDANNNNLTRTLEYWVNESWKNFEKHSWGYDSNSYCISWMYQYWENNQWTNSERESYTNDSHGNILTWLFYQWLGGNWTLTDRGEFTYDGAGHMLTKLFQYLNNGNWYDWARYTYNYDANGNAVNGLFQRKSDQGNWYPDWGTIYLYYNEMADFNIVTAISATASYLLNPTAIENQETLPLTLELLPNYPNPFNPVTNISFTLNATRKVKLAVYDMLGNEQAVLVNEEKIPGNYTESFDARDLPSGVYFYKLTAGGETRTGKMVLLK